MSVAPPPKPVGRRRKLITYVVGWIFLVLGVLGLFLPILQGILFLAIGLFVLSTVSPRVRLWRWRLRRRYPNWAGVFDHAEAKSRHWLRRITGRRAGP